jgi:hypothetical protein
LIFLIKEIDGACPRADSINFTWHFDSPQKIGYSSRETLRFTQKFDVDYYEMVRSSEPHKDIMDLRLYDSNPLGAEYEVDEESLFFATKLEVSFKISDKTQTLVFEGADVKKAFSKMAEIVIEGGIK